MSRGHGDNSHREQAETGRDTRSKGLSEKLDRGMLGSGMRRRARCRASGPRYSAGVVLRAEGGTMSEISRGEEALLAFVLQKADGSTAGPCRVKL